MLFSLDTRILWGPRHRSTNPLEPYVEEELYLPIMFAWKSLDTFLFPIVQVFRRESLEKYSISTLPYSL